MKEIENMQIELFEIKVELEAYAALFCALDEDKLRDGHSLYGVGLRFSELSQRVQKINDNLHSH